METADFKILAGIVGEELALRLREIGVHNAASFYALIKITVLQEEMLDFLELEPRQMIELGRKCRPYIDEDFLEKIDTVSVPEFRTGYRPPEKEKGDS